MAILLFFLFAALAVGSVLGMIISRNQAYSALFLVLAFACLGGLYGLLGAPFMAVVQIIIYAGAIMVLFIFVIMMINLGEGISPEKKKWTIAAAVFMGLILLAEIVFAIKGAPAVPMIGQEMAGTSPIEIGRLLFTKYLYPFEITSILIIAALVGAVVLVKKRDGE
ncbi:MAG: NADH-quinone oxidoreductase subunit J [Candidatus Aminicenantes bacterium]|nr:NADH-quinone oxidoreductase subunit J [Candidatus Aminicenantes bacterium]